MIIKLNLQLFTEKTEKPTPKRKREAREEGQILQSREFTTVAILFGCFYGLKLLGGFMTYQLKDIMIDLFNQTNNSDVFFNSNNLMINFLKLLTGFLIVAGPILIIAFLVSLIVNYFQIGFLFTTKTLKLKLNRINPLEGMKKLFSKRSLTELLKSILKITLVGYFTIDYAKDQINRVINYLNMEVLDVFINFADLTFSFVVRILFVLLLLAAMDFFFQWREHEKNLRMSKQEIKEEYKMTEGDPHIKGKIKQKQRQLATSRMMQEVPKADVIITNPTHFAVAIKYDRDKYEAPYIVGKGADLIAQNIKKVGKDNNVPIVENKPLARALYDSVDIGDIIPEDLYEAVAEVLAYVYSLRDDL